MNAKRLMEEVLPGRQTDLGVIPFALVVYLISCFTMIFFPTVLLGILSCIFFIALLFIFRIHILQILFVGLVLSRILPEVYGALLGSATVMGIILVLLWILIKILYGGENIRLDKYLNIIIVAYLILALNGIISIAYNSNISSFAMGEIIKFILCAIFLMLCYHLIDSAHIIERLFRTILMLAILTATYGYYLVYKIGISAFIIFGTTVMHGVSGGMSNPGTLASVVLYPMPILLACLMYSNDSIKKRTYLLIFIYLFPIWILWNSRGNYLFFIASFLTVLAFHKKRLKYFSVIIGLIILAFISINYIPVFRQFLRLERGLTYRGDLWIAALRMFAEGPILGKGPGYFTQFKFSYMDPGIGRTVVGTMGNATPHNVLIMRAVDLGIGGALAQITIWITSIFVLIKNAKYINDLKIRYLYLGFGAVIFGSIITSFIDVGGSMIILIFLAAILKMPDFATKFPAGSI